jgi:hypothetical protein
MRSKIRKLYARFPADFEPAISAGRIKSGRPLTLKFTLKLYFGVCIIFLPYYRSKFAKFYDDFVLHSEVNL